MTKTQRVILLFSLFVSALFLVLSNWLCFSWCDEICFVDKPYNFISYGEWVSHVSNPTQYPLYQILLVGWFYIWGVSHVSACAFEILLAELSFLYLCYSFQKRKVFSKANSWFIFLVFYWFFGYMPTLITMGRVDMLGLLLSVFIIDMIIPIKDGLVYKTWCLITSSVLLVWSALYCMPFIIFVIIYYWAIETKDVRIQLFNAGKCVFLGFLIGIALLALYSLMNGDLLQLTMMSQSLNENLSGNHSFFQRLIKAYGDIPTVLLLAVTVLLNIKAKKIRWDILLLTSSIPLLMMITGRYERYYWWMMTIPVIVLFIITINSSFSRRTNNILLLMSTFFLLVFQIILVRYPDRYKYDFYKMDWHRVIDSYTEESHLAKQIVKDHKYLIDEYKNSLFVSESFYYPIVDNGGICWYYWEAQFPDIPSTEPQKHDRSKFYWRIWDDFIRGNENVLYPNKGVFFALHKSESESFKLVLEQYDYLYDELKVQGQSDVRIIKFEKREY